MAHDVGVEERQQLQPDAIAAVGNGDCLTTSVGLGARASARKPWAERANKIASSIDEKLRGACAKFDGCGGDGGLRLPTAEAPLDAKSQSQAASAAAARLLQQLSFDSKAATRAAVAVATQPAAALSRVSSAPTPWVRSVAEAEAACTQPRDLGHLDLHRDGVRGQAAEQAQQAEQDTLFSWARPRRSIQVEACLSAATLSHQPPVAYPTPRGSLMDITRSLKPHNWKELSASEQPHLRSTGEGSEAHDAPMDRSLTTPASRSMAVSPPQRFLASTDGASMDALRSSEQADRAAAIDARDRAELKELRGAIVSMDNRLHVLEEKNKAANSTELMLSVKPKDFEADAMIEQCREMCEAVSATILSAQQEAKRLSEELVSPVSASVGLIRDELKSERGARKLWGEGLRAEFAEYLQQVRGLQLEMRIQQEQVQQQSGAQVAQRTQGEADRKAILMAMTHVQQLAVELRADRDARCTSYAQLRAELVQHLASAGRQVAGDIAEMQKSAEQKLSGEVGVRSMVEASARSLRGELREAVAACEARMQAAIATPEAAIVMRGLGFAAAQRGRSAFVGGGSLAADVAQAAGVEREVGDPSCASRAEDVAWREGAHLIRASQLLRSSIITAPSSPSAGARSSVADGGGTPFHESEAAARLAAHGAAAHMHMRSTGAGGCGAEVAPRPADAGAALRSPLWSTNMGMAQPP